jgi:hypothetical protein
MFSARILLLVPRVSTDTRWIVGMVVQYGTAVSQMKVVLRTRK